METSDMISFKHPRRGSDFCIHSTKEHKGSDYTICGVLDTIGRPRRRRMKRIVKEIQAMVTDIVQNSAYDGLEQMDELFLEGMKKVNALTRSLGEKEKNLFGFCLAFAVKTAKRVKVHWIGDCRAYRFACTDSGNDRVSSADCLTRDNNRLSTKMHRIEEDEERNDEIELLKNELLDLSRQLEYYLGIGDDDHLVKLLREQSVEVELENRDVLMLSTDGLFMPVLRNAVAHNGFMLSRELLYLEEWLREYINNGQYLQNYEGLESWRAMEEDLKKACIKYTRGKGRYRDDMAVIFML